MYITFNIMLKCIDMRKKIKQGLSDSYVLCMTFCISILDNEQVLLLKYQKVLKINFESETME